MTGRPLDAVTPDDPAAALAGDARAETQSSYFSYVRIPRTVEPLQQALAAEGREQALAAEGRGLATAGVGPLILGCDAMFLLDGKAYGTPHTPDVARERLRRMSGATGELWTGHCLIDFATGRVAKGASKATLHFSEFSDAMIERYIATGEPDNNGVANGVTKGYVGSGSTISVSDGNVISEVIPNCKIA